MNSATEEEAVETDPEVEVENEQPRLLENDTGSDQDISEDEEFEDSIGDENSEFTKKLTILCFQFR